MSEEIRLKTEAAWKYLYDEKAGLFPQAVHSL